jgi:hypothetical protein
VFGGCQLVYRSSVEVNDNVKPLGRLQGLVVLAAFALTIFAYWTILAQSYASPEIFLERTDRRHCPLLGSCADSATVVSPAHAVPPQ